MTRNITCMREEAMPGDSGPTGSRVVIKLNLGCVGCDWLPMLQQNNSMICKEFV